MKPKLIFLLSLFLLNNQSYVSAMININIVEDEPDEHDIAINVDPELDFGENVTDNIGKNPFIGGWKTDNEL